MHRVSSHALPFVCAAIALAFLGCKTDSSDGSNVPPDVPASDGCGFVFRSDKYAAKADGTYDKTHMARIVTKDNGDFDNLQIPVFYKGDVTSLEIAVFGDSPPDFYHLSTGRVDPSDENFNSPTVIYQLKYVPISASPNCKDGSPEYATVSLDGNSLFTKYLWNQDYRRFDTEKLTKISDIPAFIHIQIRNPVNHYSDGGKVKTYTEYCAPLATLSAKPTLDATFDPATCKFSIKVLQSDAGTTGLVRKLQFSKSLTADGRLDQPEVRDFQTTDQTKAESWSPTESGTQYLQAFTYLKSDCRENSNDQYKYSDIQQVNATCIPNPPKLDISDASFFTQVSPGQTGTWDDGDKWNFDNLAVTGKDIRLEITLREKKTAEEIKDALYVQLNAVGSQTSTAVPNLILYEFGTKHALVKSMEITGDDPTKIRMTLDESKLNALLDQLPTKGTRYSMDVFADAAQSDADTKEFDLGATYQFGRSRWDAAGSGQVSSLNAISPTTSGGDPQDNSAPEYFDYVKSGGAIYLTLVTRNLGTNTIWREKRFAYPKHATWFMQSGHNHCHDGFCAPGQVCEEFSAFDIAIDNSTHEAMLFSIRSASDLQSYWQKTEGIILNSCFNATAVLKEGEYPADVNSPHGLNPGLRWFEASNQAIVLGWGLVSVEAASGTTTTYGSTTGRSPTDVQGSLQWTAAMMKSFQASVKGLDPKIGSVFAKSWVEAAEKNQSTANSDSWKNAVGIGKNAAGAIEIYAYDAVEKKVKMIWSMTR